MKTKNSKSLAMTGMVLLVLTIQSCAGSPAVQIVDIGEIKNREWFLEEVKKGSEIIRIDAARGDAYTLRFDDDRINGMAAPNRYFAPYMIGENGAVSIGTIAGTLMAPLFERDDLREREYFVYLEKTQKWELKNEKLQLYSNDENGIDVILIFSEK